MAEMIRYPDRMSDGQTVAYKLLGILQHIAPDAAAQKACTDLHNSYHLGRLQDAAMASALVDGYLYGNWPWVDVSRLGEGK